MSTLRVGTLLKHPPTGKLIFVRQVVSPTDIRGTYSDASPDSIPWTINMEACEVVCLEIRDDPPPFGLYDPIHQTGLTAQNQAVLRLFKK